MKGTCQGGRVIRPNGLGTLQQTFSPGSNTFTLLYFQAKDCALCGSLQQVVGLSAVAKHQHVQHVTDPSCITSTAAPGAAIPHKCCQHQHERSAQVGARGK